MQNISLLAMALTLLWAGVEGNSHGAPLSSCENLGAIHVAFRPNEPTTNPSPFGITLSKVIHFDMHVFHKVTYCELN